MDIGIGFSKKVLHKTNESNTFGLSIINGLTEQLNGSICYYNNKSACIEMKITYR